MKKIVKRIQQVSNQEERAILLICMGIAFVFWLLVKLSQPYKTNKAVVINTQIDEEMAFVKLPPNNLVVELEGSGWDLLIDHFYRSSVTLNYNLQSREGLSLSRGQLRSAIKNSLYSDDLKILDVNYDNLNLVLEEKAFRKVPVFVKDSFSFAPEFQLKQPVMVTPDSVLVEGPVTMVESIEAWSTATILGENMKNSFSNEVALESPPPELSLSAETVTIEVEIEPITEKSMYVPIVVQNAPDSIRIFPDKVNVSCKMGLSKYDSVTYRNFTAVVNLENISPNSPNNTIPIIITEQPAYVKGIHFSPKSAKFFYVEK
jgi:hypothetical protein